MTAKAIFELDAQYRQERGKGHSRRMRRLQGKIPAIIYGSDKAPTAISLDHHKVMHALENKAFYSHILTLNFKDSQEKEQVILKDLQRHHFKKAINHMDFQRVSNTREMHLHVPLRFIGESNCPAIKAGAMINHHLMDIEVRCLATALPEYIEVDVSHMILDQILHLSDLSLPQGVHLIEHAQAQSSEHNHAVISLHLPRQQSEPETAEVVKVTEVPLKGKESTAATTPKEHAPKDKSKGK